jgi:hypothetical protein
VWNFYDGDPNNNNGSVVSRDACSKALFRKRTGSALSTGGKFVSLPSLHLEHFQKRLQGKELQQNNRRNKYRQSGVM